MDTRGGKGSGFALFGETLLAGVVIAVLSAPLVTALPALAAGSAHLDRHLRAESLRLGDLLGDFLRACRDLWQAALGATGLAVLLLWNLSLAESGLLPGSAAMLPATAAAATVWGVLLLRTAAAWAAAEPGGAGGATCPRRAARRAVRDLPGSALLTLALALATLLVWMLLPLLLTVGGLLALAAVAVEGREAAPARGSGQRTG